MWVKHVELKNFGCHESLSLDFTHGLVAIMGPNGCGKSTVTDAIYAAITGDFGRFAGVKGDCIRAAADSGDESSVTVVVEHDGQELKILRGLRPVRNRLWVPGKDPLTKVPEIQAELEARLGVTSKLLGRFCFVSQWQMFAFLSDTPGDRAKIYQTLCGTEKAQEICDAIAKLTDRDESLNVKIDDNTDELRQRIAESIAELDKVKAAQEIRRKALLSDEQIQKAKAVLAKYDKYNLYFDMLPAAKSQEEDLQAKLIDAEFPVANFKRQVEDIRRLLVPAEKQAKEAEIALSQLAEYEKRTARKAKLESEREFLDKALVDNEAPSLHPQDAELEALEEVNAGYRQQYAEAKSQLEKMQSGTSVEKQVRIGYDVNLGYSVDENTWDDRRDAVGRVDKMFGELVGMINSPDDIERLQERVKQLRTDGAAQLAIIRGIKEARQAVVEHTNWLKLHQGKIEQNVKALAELEDIPAVAVSKDDLVAAVAEFRKVRDALESKKAQLNKVVAEAARLNGMYVAAREKVAEITQNIEANVVSDDLYTRVNTAMTRNSTALAELAPLNAKAEYLEKLIIGDSKQLDRVESLIRRTQRARAFVNKIGRIRDEVLHRQALPQLVAQANLKGMEADINDVLETFGSPFWVEASEDLSFLVHFPGEPPRSADRLSGGQKGVLAVAFRTAISSLFGAEVGMMALDEPTAGMDDRNVSYLAEALGRYASKVRGRRQVIMITHADQLRPAFDQVVDLAVVESR